MEKLQKKTPQNTVDKAKLRSYLGRILVVSWTEAKGRY